MDVNFLGSYDTLDDIWVAHPEGGREGDYIHIGEESYSWNKYTLSWEPTPPEESSALRPIVDNSQEGVVEYSDGYINYIGAFDTLEQAWAAFPEGGKEGDYILVDGEQLKWNKYTNNWGAADPDASTPARPVATLYGDLHVHNDVVVGEDLIAEIFKSYATKVELKKLTPQRVASEEIMEEMIKSGNYDEEQIYYVPEED